ncbi:MAG: hypothetical protein HC880_13295 [Bacteroidia bacterium]|nr:hypothetical protein [Bacteroidia bacterium]
MRYLFWYLSIFLSIKTPPIGYLHDFHLTRYHLAGQGRAVFGEQGDEFLGLLDFGVVPF